MKQRRWTGHAAPRAPRFKRACLPAAVALLVAGAGVHAQTVGDTDEYVAALAALNGGPAGQNATIGITGGATIVPGTAATIALHPDSTLTIDGGGTARLSGGDAWTPVVIVSGDVVLRDLALANGLARGGDGSGGGAGLGGGAFVAAGSSVTMERIEFIDNAAIGGNGSSVDLVGGVASFMLGATNANGSSASGTTGGTGGMNLPLQLGAGNQGGTGGDMGLPGSPGQPPGVSGGGGGTTLPLAQPVLGGGPGGYARYGDVFHGGEGGAGGGVGGGGRGGVGGPAPNGGGGGGGAWGGGGGAGAGASQGGLSCGGGGGGGYGGGGGAAAAHAHNGNSCHQFGYGNGGAGGGGFGGGAGGLGQAAAFGGFGGGDSPENVLVGGGGMGAGGHVFVMDGATLRLIDPQFGPGTASGGSGGPDGEGGDGAAIGQGIFLGGDVTVLPSTGTTITVGIDDFFGGSADPRAQSQADGALRVGDAAHAGQLILNAPNSYAGGTIIGGGVLTAGHANPFGTGQITFAGGTLRYGTGITTDFSPRFSPAPGQPYAIDTNGNDVSFVAALASAGGSLRKLGDGTLTLLQDASYDAGTVVEAGALQLGDGGAFGWIVGDVDLAGGQLSFNRSGTNVFAGAISGTGGVSIASGRVLFPVGHTYAGGTTIASGAELEITAGGSIQGDVSNAGALTFAPDGALEYAGSISGDGALNKTGPGRLVLTGVSTHAGPTNVTAGELQVDGALGAGTLAVSNDATLAGAGMASGPVSLQDNAQLSPGPEDGAGTLGLAALTLSAGSRSIFGLGAGTGDQVVVAGNLVLDGILDIVDLGGFPGDAERFTLFRYDGTLTDNGLDLGSLPAGSQWLVDTSEPGRVDLRRLGTGTLLVAPDAVDFGSVTLGQEAAANVTVSNVGTKSLTITAIDSAPAPFQSGNGTCGPLPIELAPGESCTRTYRFVPMAAGAASADIVHVSTAGEAVLSLSGTGVPPVDPPPPPPPPPVDATPVPTLDPRALALLAVLVLAVAAGLRKRQPR